jgi:hypothetical protein
MVGLTGIENNTLPMYGTNSSELVRCSTLRGKSFNVYLVERQEVW